MIDLKNELNDKQYEAANTIEGPILIIAGAGSGKTRMITYRIGAMIVNHNINPKNILALTFTNKAAREMEERIKNLTSNNIKELSVSTFHAFGLSILKKHIHLLGYNQRFTIYDSNDQQSAIKETARELQVDTATLSINELATLFSNIKTKREEWNSSNVIHKSLYETYCDMLKTYNALDFDDLITLPIQIFNEHPHILKQYQERFRYIMVDEFQDTSLIQYEFIALIARHYKNICVVGDDDQSIYSWRGANYQNIVNFEKDFPNRKEIMLEQNYRSTGNILSAANNLISNNTNRKAKKLWTPGEDGKSINMIFAEDEYDEATQIASLLHNHRYEDHINYNEFGILLRTNNLISTIEEELLAQNIPYKISGGSSFFQRKEIKDIIAYLKVIVNPDDEISILRIINIPRRGIGLQTIKKVQDIAKQKQISFYSALLLIAHAEDAIIKIGETGKKSICEFVELIESYQQKFETGKNIATTTQDLVSNINYWGYLIFDNPDNPDLAKYKYTNISKFIQMMQRWEENPDNLDTRLHRYITRITLLTSEEDSNDNEVGKVNLMTIHASKGLEFDITFLAGVEDHIIPLKRSLDENPKNIEEERRLFYVAITRAKQKLYISSCATRKINKKQEPVVPSRFLSEIPNHLLKPINDEIDPDAFFSQMISDWENKEKE